MKTLLKNCRIVNHNETKEANILIEDEIIKSITTDEPEADKVIDIGGKTVMPGLIDMHVHFRDPGLEYKEDIESGSEAAVAGGVTTVCPMANTKPVNDNRVTTEFMVKKAMNKGLIDLLPVGAVTKGMKGEELVEMGDMLEAGACAFSDDGLPVLNSDVMRRAMEYAKGFGAMILSHSEDKHLAGGGVINEGEVSTITGLKGIPAETEEIMIARDILISKLTGGHMHICHVSTEGSLKLIKWAKEQGYKVTCEVTPHHFTLSDNELLNYDTNFKMNPPLRTQADVQAMKDGLADGTIDCIATDHAPHHIDEKFQEFDLAPFGITGLQTLIPLTLNLVRSGVITENEMAKLCSYTPAKLLKLDNKGAVAEGMLADLTVIDTELEYTFNKELNRSKGVNSPFMNKPLKGIAVKTIKNGNVVYEYNG
ncbi:dihydroorotase [Limisalsivibrio acetivorans]|uniref:dihydroorotase n=1 Tax=Limisalsivibrio acetivorans TaxID=1304888 RepID=UPI0003B47EB1|nr:dihydroorotase [Limisalsivibrio acetivorans]